MALLAERVLRLIFSRSKRAAAGNAQASGFTLLEMLMVMLLLGLLMGVTFPRMQAWYTGLAARQEAAAVLAQLRQLPARAASQRKDLALAQGLASVAMPANWRLVQPGGVVFLASGLCLGGEAVFAVAAPVAGGSAGLVPAAQPTPTAEPVEADLRFKLLVSPSFCNMEWSF